jgi:hypothetical protein
MQAIVAIMYLLIKNNAKPLLTLVYRRSPYSWFNKSYGRNANYIWWDHKKERYGLKLISLFYFTRILTLGKNT